MTAGSAASRQAEHAGGDQAYKGCRQHEPSRDDL